MKGINERAFEYARKKVGYDITKPFKEQEALVVIMGKYKEEYRKIANEQFEIDLYNAKQAYCCSCDNPCCPSQNRCDNYMDFVNLLEK